MVNWGGAASGAITGAGTGASFGPAGSVFGALAGGALGLFGGEDEEATYGNYESLSPEQLQLRQQILQHLGPLNDQGMQYLNQILSDDPALMEQFAAPAKRQFQEETIPQILERFSGAGARSSSALNQTLGQAGQRLNEGLNAQHANLKGGAINALQGLNSQALQSSQQPYTIGGKQSVSSQLAPLAGDSFKQLLSMLKENYGQKSPGGASAPAKQSYTSSLPGFNSASPYSQGRGY